jgi:hypothetical protein
MLERSTPGDEHWSIDRLTVDIGLYSLDALERDFVAAVTQAIGRELKEGAAGLQGAPHRTGRALARDGLRLAGGTTSLSEPHGPIERRTDVELRREAFLYFLATGMLPWWFRLPSGHTLEGAITASWQMTGLSAERGRALVKSC